MSEMRDQKRAAFASAEKKRRRASTVFALAVVIPVAALAVYSAAGSGSQSSEAGEVTIVERKVSTTERDVMIPLSQIQGPKAKFFKYTASNGAQMRFFAMRSSDGVYRAALDACDVCYRSKQGYYQDGDDMVCRKCGQKFHSALVNEVTGGCNPVALARVVQGGNLVIKASELESRASFF